MTNAGDLYTFCDIVIPDGIPAIVPKESCSTECRKRWRKTEKPLPDIRQRTIIYITTKLFCEYCGAYLCEECGTSRTGVVHHYYKCVSVMKKHFKHISALTLLLLVLLCGFYLADEGYPADETALAALSQGDDGVRNREAYGKHRANLSEDFTETVPDGGCHAYFGAYGMQRGDGTPTNRFGRRRRRSRILRFPFKHSLFFQSGRPETPVFPLPLWLLPHSP